MSLAPVEWGDELGTLWCSAGPAASIVCQNLGESVRNRTDNIGNSILPSGHSPMFGNIDCGVGSSRA